MMHTFYEWLTLLVFVSLTRVCNSNPVVSTKYGLVEGLSVPIHTGDIIDSYLNIPYAKPPIGQLRFAMPEEPESWEDTLLAHETGNACIQALVNGVFLTHWGYEKFDEDCLSVNIYTPQRNSSELLPVNVFIHGGDFENGANFMYLGYYQAARDVVVVNINYRLGILGFASTEDEVLPGNLGLHDQALALRFVQENIAQFGGDPQRVTLSGESAGAASVGMHVVSPISDGLFQQAILQSGTELDYWCLHGPEHNPANYLIQVAEGLNCTTETSQAMVDCLRTKDAQRLQGARYDCEEGYSCDNFRPIVDGIFLPDLPSALRERGEFKTVPEMIGINTDEGSLGLLVLFPDGDVENGINRTTFDERIYAELELVAPSWTDPDRLEDAAQALRFQYADWPYYNDPIALRQMYIDMYSDLYFGHSSDSQSKYHSAAAPVYYYVFNYTYENGNIADYYGAYHAAELRFVFGDTWHTEELNALAWNHSGYIYNPNYNVFDATETDVDMTEFMISLWTNYIKTGNPTPEPIGPGEGPSISWPELVPDNLTYAYLTPDARIDVNYRQAEYAFWNSYFPYITFGEGFPYGTGSYRRSRPLQIDAMLTDLLTE